MLNITTSLPSIDVKMYYLSASADCFHPECRFLTLLKGRLIFSEDSPMYGKQSCTLSSGDIIYLPSNSNYHLSIIEASTIMYTCFHPLTLLDAMGFEYETIYCNSAVDTLKSYDLLLKCISSLATSIFSSSSSNEYLIYSKAFELFHCLAKEFLIRPSIDYTPNKQEAKLIELTDFISKHYDNAPSLSDTAKKLNYTPPYLSNFIKKHMNCTYNDLITKYKLKASTLYLRFSDEPDSRIAVLCGFSSSSAFTKNFNEDYGITTDEYRKKYHIEYNDQIIGATVIDNPALILDYVYNYLQYTETSDIINRDTSLVEREINVNHQRAYTPSWNMIINVGKASDFVKPTFRRQIISIQNGLHFKYGRIVGLLELSRTFFVSDIKHFDFSHIFEVIDFMSDIGLTPFVDIDNKPFHIYKAQDYEKLDYKEFLNVDDYDTFLYEILPYFIKACINRYGFEKFSSWKFEVWRRYNPSMTSMESPRQYAARFQKIAKIFKDFDPEFVVGGPGFNSYLTSDYFEKIISAFDGLSYVPDFFSAYFFPYIPADASDKTRLSNFIVDKSPSTMGKKVSELVSIIKKHGYGDKPFYITEYTSYLLASNYVNDSSYPAVFILGQFVANYGKSDGMGYYLASDFSIDYSNPGAPFFGGNGIISKDGIKKSSYYAFDFLKQLGEKLIYMDSQYIITALDGAFQILLFNYCSISQEPINNPSGQSLLHYSHSAFGDEKPLEFNLYLTHIPSGQYSIKEMDIDLKSGNVLNSWGELNYLKNLRPADIEYIMNKSIPTTSKHIETITGEFLLHSILNPSEAKFFAIEPYL